MAGSARIVGLAMVGNEADIIEPFVRHHARLLDELVLIVHRPVDGTAEILSNLRADGLPLALRTARHVAFRQADEIGAAARELLGGAATHVALLDADEFLKLPDPGYMRRAAPSLPAGRFGAYRWQSYVPLPGDDPSQPNPLKRIRHRRREEGIESFKVLLTRDFLHQDCRLLEGNHCVMQARPSGELAPAPMVELKAIRLAHFPVRSRTQLETKVILGELAKRVEGTADPSSLGSHWRELFAGLRDGERFDADTLRRVAVRYGFPGDARLDVADDGFVEDPVACDFELRYPAAGSRDALQNLLSWLESGPLGAQTPEASTA